MSHITKMSKDGPAHYSWTCSCGEAKSGYFTEFRARNSAHLHRTMQALKEIK